MNKTATRYYSKGWICTPRIINQRYRDSKCIEKYSSLMSLQEKIHICDKVLPEECEILIRNDEEVYVFIPSDCSLHGDETEYPLEKLVNEIIEVSIGESPT